MKRWHRSSPAAALAALGALAAGLAACEGPVEPAALPARLAALERPNVVLIVVDTLRADATSPWDGPEGVSPELARWADRGLVFERALAQSSWTKISMASLLTSRWPSSHGIREATDGLAGAAVTLAEALHEAGYRTYGVQTNGWLHQSFGFHQGFDRYVFPAGRGARLPAPTVWPHVDRVYAEAARLLDAHVADADGAPFFLYLHFMDVHEYAAPPEFKTFGTDDEGAYRAAVRWVDDGLERVREKLDAVGVLGDTILVFASDHGETFGEHGVRGHARNVLTPVLHVPLLIRLPFAVEPVRVSAQVTNLDVAPTILDLAGVPVPESFEGRSLLPLVTGGPEADGDRINFAGLGTPIFQDSHEQVSVTDGHWTFARNRKPEDDPAEFLYDRSVDPGENVNLVEREPEQAARMRALLDANLAQEKPAVRERDVRIDPSIAEKLRAIGYMQ